MKMKDRLHLIITVIILCMMPGVAQALERHEILKVYNWADYIDEDLLPEFEKWYQRQTGKYIHV